jgi:hypothetical protein
MFVNNADLRTKLKQELKADTDHIDFLPFGDLEQSVRDDVAPLRASPLIPAVSCRRVQSKNAARTLFLRTDVPRSQYRD